MNPFSLPPLATALIAFSLGYFVFSKNRRSPLNITFALLCLATFWWQLTWVILFNTEDPKLAFYLVKIGYTGIIFIPITFFHFVVNFLGAKEKKFLFLSYLLGFIFVISLWSTNYFVRGFYEYFWGYYPKAGFLHPLHLLQLLIMTLRMVFLLISHIKAERLFPVRYNQIKYILCAIGLYFPAAADYADNYGLEFYPLGFIFVLSSIGIFAYAIVRHHLMEIEVVIKRTLVFAGLFGFIFGIIALLTFITQDLLGKYIGIPRFWALTMGVVIIVLLHDPVKNFLINSTNRFLFQKKYDPRQLLKDFGDRVLTVLNLGEIVTSTIDVLVKSLNTETCTVLLLNRDEARYEVHSSYGLKDERISFGAESKIASYLGRTHEVILKDSYDENLEAPKAVGPDMERIGSHLCIPLLLHDEMIGILSLGKKRSDEPYNRDDVDILSTLAKTVAIAISNAQLFLEAAQSEKLAAIGTLAAGIGHEVCNPLNTISTNIQVFLESLKLGFYKRKTQEELVDEAKRIMEGCLKDMNKIGDIAKNLASFAKPVKEVAMKAVNISDEVDEALAIVGHGLELEKIEVEKIVSPELPSILAGKGQLRQIFFNLIRNAAQAIEGSGKITILAKRHDDKIQIEITDTGRGIPEDKLRRIYDPFFTTRAPGMGTGLGLSIVRQLVGRNKGKIFVRSKVGRGTTFLLEFPVST